MPGRAGWRPATLAACLVLAAACARPVSPLAPAPATSPTPAPPVRLPADAAPHDALTEWWYYTGHLRDAEGAEYGFEFTVFQVRRQGIEPVLFDHFAVTDVGGQRFSHQARYTQAESRGFPLDVQGWRLDSADGQDRIEASMRAGPGADPPFGLRLSLRDEKPPALHHGGYIDYGPAGASYYYSRTRLAVSGDLRVGEGPPRAVEGIAWMDHQWGNFVVAGGGWDWYSLQLDDRSDLMLYVLRDAAGHTSGVYGTRVLADGRVEDLGADAVRAEATGQWTSPHTGAVYPSGWHLRLPDGTSLRVTPLVADQELYFPAGVSAPPGASGAVDAPAGADAGAGVANQVTYWEGAVRVDGDRAGTGYVELTGYAP